ncbi:MAG: hypothetical protein ACRDKX_02650 [Solirubrobacterales bacterium]
MSLTDSGKAICPDTGLAVPECSCRRCLEAMVREFSPLRGEIKVTRLARRRPGEPGAERRPAA